MRLVWIWLVIWPGAVLGWERLDSDGINAALSDRSVQYDQYTLQHFRKSGLTDYITERFSQGRWAARGDQYCSTWPPSDIWTCYDVEVEGEAVRFISSDGSISEGVFLE